MSDLHDEIVAWRTHLATARKENKKLNRSLRRKLAERLDKIASDRK